jgi:uncharacterized protein (DUF2225 family)
MEQNQEQSPRQASAFITKSVTCPICQQSSPQRRIKRHIYQEQDREIDLRPRSYLWKAKGLAVPHPLIHFLWHCPTCRFTAWPSAWENPLRGVGVTLAKYREALRPRPSEDPATAMALGLLLKGLTWPELDFFQGLRLHLLAALELVMLKRATGVQDSINLGRYCLRLSWLYRELGERPELSPAATQMRALAQALAPHWPDAPLDEGTATRQAVAYYEAGAAEGSAVEDVDDLCNLLLLITRLHLKLRQWDPARLYWSKAFELARNLEQRKQQMEGDYHQLQDRARSAALAVAEMARQRQEELTKAIVEIDAKARGMRFKVQQMRDLIQDEMDGLPPVRPAGPARAGGAAGATGAAKAKAAGCQAGQAGQEAPQEEYLDLDLNLKPKKKRLRDLFK